MAVNDTLNADLNPGFGSNKTWRKRAPGQPPTPQFRWNERNRDKLVAHYAVRAALHRGELTRGPCAVCGSAIVDAHHDDYSRPLDVTWLCRRHHQQRHAEMRRAGS